MKHIISKYKIKLVKEESARYECENTITSPDAVSYTHLDVYKRQILHIIPLYYMVCNTTYYTIYYYQITITIIKIFLFWEYQKYNINHNTIKI